MYEQVTTTQIVINAWLILSQIVFVIWAFRPKMYFDVLDWGVRSWPFSWLAVFTGVSAWLGFSIVLKAGYTEALAFIPSTWGWEGEENGWTSLSENLALIFSLGISVAVVILLINYNFKRRITLHKEAPGPGPEGRGPTGEGRS